VLRDLTLCIIGLYQKVLPLLGTKGPWRTYGPKLHTLLHIEETPKNFSKSPSGNKLVGHSADSGVGLPVEEDKCSKSPKRSENMKPTEAPKKKDSHQEDPVYSQLTTEDVAPYRVVTNVRLDQKQLDPWTHGII